MMSEIVMIAILALMVGVVRLKVMPTEAWYRPLKNPMDVTQEYDAIVATNQPEYQEKQKVFADTHLLSVGEYVITRFSASWAVQKAWANSGLWPCGRIGRVPSDGKPDYGLVDGDEVWAVYESNGDLVDASWAEQWSYGFVAAEEWAAFQEWAIWEYKS